ncbi:hypothetical protein EV191_101614 [Tamaricihabitans halophyticus]|uniref:Copper(I)-binding protein n=1 Tax=Tamaricihabitans halophyticus TaxID=1262583 RepID=A0A4R2R4N5_9PSEU|nr:hypothetical protein EV191_101614 [Tamaricihabitans halophyticus]
MSWAQRKSAGRGARLRAAWVAGVAGVALTLAGCGAGQITQTSEQDAAVNGASADVKQIAIRNAELAFKHDSQGVYRLGDSAPLLGRIINSGERADELVEVRSEFADEVTVDGATELRSEGVLVGTEPDGWAEETAAEGTGAQEPGTEAPGTAEPDTAEPGTAESDTAESDTEESGTDGSAAPEATGSAAPTTTSAPRTSASDAPAERDAVRIVLVGLKGDVTPGKTVPLTFVFRNAGEVQVDVPIAYGDTEREQDPAEH